MRRNFTLPTLVLAALVVLLVPPYALSQSQRRITMTPKGGSHGVSIPLSYFFGLQGGRVKTDFTLKWRTSKKDSSCARTSLYFYASYFRLSAYGVRSGEFCETKNGAFVYREMPSIDDLGLARESGARTKPELLNSFLEILFEHAYDRGVDLEKSDVKEIRLTVGDLQKHLEAEKDGSRLFMAVLALFHASPKAGGAYRGAPTDDTYLVLESPHEGHGIFLKEVRLLPHSALTNNQVPQEKKIIALKFR